MSEIKGQILGVVLVLAIFAVVGGTLYTAFSNSATKVSSKIEGSWTFPGESENDGKATQSSVTDVNLQANQGLLTF